MDTTLVKINNLLKKVAQNRTLKEEERDLVLYNLDYIKICITIGRKTSKELIVEIKKWLKNDNMLLNEYLEIEKCIVDHNL